MMMVPRRVLDRARSLRIRNMLPIVSVGAAIAAVAFGVIQLISVNLGASPGALHPDDVVVTGLGRVPLAARENPVAVSTGREVIIWGGDDGAGHFFADGAAYDLATGRWHRIAAAPIPGRADAVAAWVDDRMIVWGGIGAHPGPRGLNNGASYDPATDSWQVIMQAPGAGRIGASAVAYDGKLYIAGGVTPSDPRSSRILEYDPVAGNWGETATVGPVFAVLGTPSGLVTVESDPSGDKVTSHAITVSGTHALVERIDSGSIGGGVSAMTLVPDGQVPLLATTNRDGVTTVYKLSDSVGGPAWSATTRVSTSDFRAVDDIDDSLRGSMKGYPAGAVLAVGPQGVWDLRKGAGRAVLGEQDLLRHSVCGAGSAYAVTPSGIMMWGGQTCRPDGLGVTGSGVLIDLKSRV